MARITMQKVQETKLSEVFTLYLASAAARGVKDKTLRTYEQHFNAISKRLDVDSNISLITSKHLDKMILRMREDGLSDSSINSYTRTLKVFFSWCNEQGYTVLKPGGKIALLVSDSHAFKMVHIQTAELLRLVGEKAGFVNPEIELWQNKPSTSHKYQLRENILYLQKPN